MKKLLLILLLIGCTKITPIPTPPPPVKDIFSTSQSTVSNGDEVVVNLTAAGRYTLTMSDSTTSQVLTRERFIGKVGENKLKIYTKSLSVKYLYLVLEDSTKTQIGKTTITIN
jgi:hypothetical protein